MSFYFKKKEAITLFVDSSGYIVFIREQTYVYNNASELNIFLHKLKTPYSIIVILGNVFIEKTEIEHHVIPFISKFLIRNHEEKLAKDLSFFWLIQQGNLTIKLIGCCSEQHIKEIQKLFQLLSNTIHRIVTVVPFSVSLYSWLNTFYPSQNLLVFMKQEEGYIAFVRQEQWSVKEIPLDPQHSLQTVYDNLFAADMNPLTLLNPTLLSIQTSGCHKEEMRNLDRFEILRRPLSYKFEYLGGCSFIQDALRWSKYAKIFERCVTYFSAVLFLIGIYLSGLLVGGYSSINPTNVYEKKTKNDNSLNTVSSKELDQMIQKYNHYCWNTKSKRFEFEF